MAAKSSKLLMGVCAKLSKKIGLNVWIWRILWILFGCTGLGIIIYLLLGFLWVK
ncbi:MAG: PspC domain-containing protein [Bacillota bacterium]